MTLRTCSPALLVALATLAAGCGGGVEISLQLRPAVDDSTGQLFDTSALRSLTITLTPEGATPDELGIVLDRARQVPLDGITVDKSRPFSIDVWGCEDPAVCGRADVAFRGCTPEPLDFRTKDGTVPVVIQLHPVDDPRLAACPAL